MARANRSSSKREEEQMVESINEWEPVEYRSEGKVGKQGYLKKKKKKIVSKGGTHSCVWLIVPFSPIDRPLLKGRGIFSRVNDTPRAV